MTTKYVARINGEIVATRTTKDRTYTHCVHVISPSRPDWSQSSWCGRLDLAEKSARSWELNSDYVALVLPAEVVAPKKDIRKDIEGELKKRFPGMNIEVI